MTSDADRSASAPPPVHLEVHSRVVVKVLLIGTAFWVAFQVIGQLQPLIIQLAIAAFLAVAADPVVRRLQLRGMSRARAVLAVMSVGFFLLALTIAVFIPPLVKQGNRLIQTAPDITNDVQRSDYYTKLDERFDIFGTLSQQAGQLPGVVSEQLGSVVGAVAAGLFGAITILLLTVFLLLGGGQLVHGTVRLFPQLAERRWWSIVQGAYVGIAAYVGGAIAIALIGGTVLAITAFALGLPYALPLGLWMMLLEIIPMIGATIGAIPAVIVAFVAGGTVEGFIMLAVVIAYQQVENIYIQPRIQGRAAALSPLVVFISVLVGAQLLGILGALFAVPVAGVLQIFLRQIIVEQGSHELELPPIMPGGPPEPPDPSHDAKPAADSN